MKNQTILITGVTTGIGKSFIELAHTQLADCRIIAITKSKPAYTLPPNVIVYRADLTDHKKVKKIVTQILNTYGPIDTLINNAGNGWRGMIEDTTIDEAKQQMEVNVWAVVHLVQLILPGMRERRSGHIINISSVAATIDYPTIGYYCATKAFLEKISRTMALELMPWNIHISLIAPGAVQTKFGHNMINSKQYGQGVYRQLYKDWADNFERMFQKPLHSDEAAQKIIETVKRPTSYSFLDQRDTFYCYLKRLLPRRLFDRFLLKRYMHL